MKICANTCLEDALAAADLGADAVGFVFARSKRQVRPEQVRMISEELPPEVERVGVFATGTLDEIALAVEQSGVHAVQLHGGFSAEVLQLGRGLSTCFAGRISVIHTVHWPVGEGVSQEAAAERVAAELAAVAASGCGDRVLVDAKVGNVSGGLGVPFDWAVAKQVLRAQKALRVIVAGGLRPEDVAEAVRVLAPWGVDVASGVEQAPGRKDPSKVEQFIREARRT